MDTAMTTHLKASEVSGKVLGKKLHSHRNLLVIIGSVAMLAVLVLFVIIAIEASRAKANLLTDVTLSTSSTSNTTSTTTTVTVKDLLTRIIVVSGIAIAVAALSLAAGILWFFLSRGSMKTHYAKSMAGQGMTSMAGQGMTSMAGQGMTSMAGQGMTSISGHHSHGPYGHIRKNSAYGGISYLLPAVVLLGIAIYTVIEASRAKKASNDNKLITNIEKPNSSNPFKNIETIFIVSIIVAGALGVGVGLFAWLSFTRN